MGGGGELKEGHKLSLTAGGALEQNLFLFVRVNREITQRRQQ